jgi:filamentous hemagglutinin
MAIQRVSGNILQDNLQRGANLSIQGNLAYFDVTNSRVGIRTITPQDEFNVIGVANASNVRITSATANGIFYAGNTLLALTSANFTYNGTNVFTSGNIQATGNIEGGNIISDGAVIGNVEISGNLIVENLTVIDTLSGNVISATGNVTGANIISNGVIQASTANVTGNAAVGNILTNGYYYANGAPIDLQQPAGANTQIQYNFNSDFGASANLTYDQITGIFQVGYGNSGTIQTDTLNATGNVTSGNVQATSLTANRVVYVNTNDYLVDSANFTFDGANANIQGQLIVDSFTINGTSITSNANVSISMAAGFSVSTANSGNMIFTVDSTGIASFVSTTSLTIPAGNTAQRPATPETGAIRFNTGLTQVEVWDGAQWEVVGSDFVSITNQTINGDGFTNTFTLDESTTAAAIIVATNGVVQQPGVAYTVTGNLITFAEPPQISDAIDVRFTAAVTYVNAITNTSGNAEITVSDPGVANIATCDSLQLPSYTVASSANIATPAAGQIIYVTNGDSGNSCLAVYSAGAWKRVALGANISA